MKDWKDNQDPLTESMDIQIPKWIDQDITPYHVHNINLGGCESGAYMPSVTYATASETMDQHGNEVLDYIEKHKGCLPPLESGVSWEGIAVHFLSHAVELWAKKIAQELDNA